MKLQKNNILRLKINVDKQMFSLRSKMKEYRDLQDTIVNYKNQLNDFSFLFSFSRPDITELSSLEKLAQKYRELENDRFHLIREIDNISSIIAGSLVVAIDFCMENYSISLKRWIGETISDMANLREVNTPVLKLTDFSFPNATSVLIPYLYKTQTYHNPAKFAFVRNAIRELVY